MSRYYRSILATLGEFVYDTDMQAVIDKAIAESFSLPPKNVLRAMNTKLIQMKADGIWAKLDVYFNFATGSTSFANFSRICWKRRVLGTYHGGIATTVNGVEGDGVDGYFDINYDFNQAVNFDIHDGTKGSIVYKTDEVSGTNIRYIWGFNASLVVNSAINADSNRQYLRSSVLDSAFDFSGTGLKTITRTSSTGSSLTSGSTQGDRTVSDSTGGAGSSQFLFRSSSSYSLVGASNHIVSEGLTYAETQNFRTAYNQYLNKIGLTQFA
jgi:hypothetical protein